MVMLKKLLPVVFLLLALFVFPAPGDTYAQVSCPSEEMVCSTLDAQGGCEDPCIRVVTRQGGPAGRSGSNPARCACQLPATSEGSLPLGALCQGDEYCQSGHCWGEFHQSPTCQSMSRADSLAERQSDTSGEALPLETESEDDDRLICPTAGGRGINTAIGCIPYEDTNALIAFILRWAIGIGGGIAFLLIVVAGFQIMTSSGNPDRLKAGQELLTSAIAGLIMLIFSVFILRIIGVDILRLPGLV